MLLMYLLKDENFAIVLQTLPKWLCIEFLFSAMTAVIDVMFFIQIFRFKAEKLKIISFMVILGVSNLIISLIIPSQFCRIFNSIAAFCVVRWGFNQTLEKSVLGETLNAMVIIIVEIIFDKINGLVFNNILMCEGGIYNFYYNFTFKVCVIVSRALILFVLEKKKIYVSLKNHLQEKNKKSILKVSIFGMVVVIFTEIDLLYMKHNMLFLGFLLNMMLYCYISIKNILMINILEAQASKINSLEVYNKTLSIMYDSIRGFKHDFSNFVLALDGYAKTDNIAGIRQMSKAILDECATVNKMGILDPKVINNSAIYSIITNKYYLAKEQNLNMNIEILSKIDENCENNYEICRILGILLDNAIEAAKDTKEKIVNVRFVSDTKVKRKLVIVENSYDNKNVNIDKIFEKGYTSKKDVSQEHGLGLWNIRNILINNEDLNLYTTANDLFRQQLEIY